MAVLTNPPPQKKNRRIIRRLTGALWCHMLIGLVLLHSRPADAQERQVSEAQVKAACILNFPKYVEWPATVLPATNSPIIITVLAETKLSDELTKMAQGKMVEGRPLVVKKILKVEELTPDCHILFVGDIRQLPGIRNKLGHTPVLTVGEHEDFLAGGGVINLARQAKKISLEVNLAAATQAQLKISSKLLSLARVQKAPAQ